MYSKVHYAFRKINLYFHYFFFAVLASCTYTVKIKNEKEGKLISQYQLLVSGEKRILLDYETAPQPPYMQMIQGANGERTLTLLNLYKNAIYFYDYEKAVYIGKVEYEKEGPDGIPRPAGYYIKNIDSIYVFNRPIELALTDSLGRVKQRISLNNNSSRSDPWSLYYPQYQLSTVNSFVETQGKLIMTGMNPFSVADSLISKFRFTFCLDVKSDDIEFIHIYPEELYGSNANWQDPVFTQVYRELSPNGDFVYSFPVSHNLYITSYGSNDYKTVYAGSNVAGIVHSIDDGRERVPREELMMYFLQQDLYTAILHDPYRYVYYRFMLQGIRDATLNMSWKEKPVVVIIMDEQFNYMGETVIGTRKEWNSDNTFVTSEGLVMEYIDQDIDSVEEYLILKTFTIEKINEKHP